MALAFYFDHNVESAVASGLAQRGVDVLKCFDDGAADWDDERILLRAKELHRVVFTQDRDFIRIGTEYLRTGRRFFGIVFSRPQALSIGKMIGDLELIAKGMSLDEMVDLIIRLPM